MMTAMKLTSYSQNLSLIKYNGQGRADRERKFCAGRH